MATKNTTKHLAGTKWEEASWYFILNARAQDLAMDKDHSFTYGDRDEITSTTTRKKIVHLYETAYSELAESFVGHLEYINELETDKTHLNTLLNDQLSYTLALEDRLESTSRQLAGLLQLIEQPVPTTPRSPGTTALRSPETNPNQYQAMRSR